MKLVMMVDRATAEKVAEKVIYAAEHDAECAGPDVFGPLHFDAWSMSSKISIAPSGDVYKLSFEGRRGSFWNHWGIMDDLRAAYEGGAAQIVEYASSVRGMTPFEDLHGYFHRVTGERLHDLTIDDDALRAEFNHRFHSRVCRVGRKEPLTAEQLIAARECALDAIYVYPARTGEGFDTSLYDERRVVQHTIVPQ
jgi:hypothetical protein